MNRVKKIIVQFAVMAFTNIFYVFGFGLRQLVKFAGLNPDESPYQKYIYSLKKALDTNPGLAYEEGFDFSKYVKVPARPANPAIRPSFKFTHKESVSPSLKVTETFGVNEKHLELQKKIQELVKSREEVFSEKNRPRLKELVSKIQKAAEETPKKTVRRRATKKAAKKVA